MTEYTIQSVRRETLSFCSGALFLRQQVLGAGWRRERDTLSVQ